MIGAFITITNPEERGDLYKECIEMANQCFDTVTIIDGKNTWPQEFSWPLIGEHFQKGYEQTNADWVFHLDTDFIFHEQDYDAIRKACENNPEAPALSFWKYQFISPNKYSLKSRLVLAVNKKKYGDRIKFDSAGDLCQPSLDGVEIKPDSVPEARVPFYNYEKPLKTKEQIRDDVDRMDRAYERHFGKVLYSKNGTAFDGWMEMALGRANKPQEEVSLSFHPKVMHETLKNLKPNQFGYDAFGNLQKCKYIDTI